MSDRTDIDALLIGALYGELTPAEEAQLAAHLESHPADRSALAGLTRTRAAVRESRILAPQLEPPQALSALLIQEAARRQPRVAKDEPDRAGWFFRFLRTFMAHPAMAAAAMLVVVVGVAGTLYVRRGDHFAETAPPAVTLPASKEYAMDSAAVVPSATGAAVEEAAVAAPPPSAVATAPVAPAAEPAADLAFDPEERAKGAKQQPADSYRVDLAENARRQRAAQSGDGDGADRDERRVAEGAGQRVTKGGKALTKLEGARLAPPAAPNQPSGIVLRTPEPAPKDLPEESDKLAKRDVRRESAPQGNAEGKTVARDDATSGRGAGSVVGGAGGAGPGDAGRAGETTAGAPAASKDRAVPQNTAPAAAPPRKINDAEAEAPARGAKFAQPAKPKAPAKAVPQPSPALEQATAPAPPPPPPASRPASPAAGARGPGAPDDRASERSAVDSAASRAADEKPTGKPTEKPTGKADDASLLDWAQKQHAQVVALVQTDCVAAANAAMAIYSRAPDYYANSVATDRAVKPCLAYVNRAREREDRGRASKQAPEAPAKAAPAKKKY